MGYAESVWGRAMQVQEVVFRAIAGEIHWFRAANLLGVSAPISALIAAPTSTLLPDSSILVLDKPWVG